MSGLRVAAITRRILAQFRRDHRTVALLFVVPVLVTGLLGWIVTEGQAVPPRVTTVILSPAIADRVEAIVNGQWTSTGAVMPPSWRRRSVASRGRS